MEFIALYQELHDSLEMIRVFLVGLMKKSQNPVPSNMQRTGK